MPVIYSTASNDSAFPIYERIVSSTATRASTSPAVTKKTIFIKGRANVKNEKTFVTPRGVATTVTDEALVELKKNDIFMRMVKNGFMTIDEKSNKKPSATDANKFATKNMEAKDKSAQMTEKDFASLKLPGIKGSSADGIEVDEDEVDAA